MRISCRCGRSQTIARTGKPGGVTYDEAKRCGWRRTGARGAPGNWICPFCAGNASYRDRRDRPRLNPRTAIVDQLLEWADGASVSAAGRVWGADTFNGILQWSPRDGGTESLAMTPGWDSDTDGEVPWEAYRDCTTGENPIYGELRIRWADSKSARIAQYHTALVGVLEQVFGARGNPLSLKGRMRVMRKAIRGREPHRAWEVARWRRIFASAARAGDLERWRGAARVLKRLGDKAWLYRQNPELAPTRWSEGSEDPCPACGAIPSSTKSRYWASQGKRYHLSDCPLDPTLLDRQDKKARTSLVWTHPKMRPLMRPPRTPKVHQTYVHPGWKGVKLPERFIRLSALKKVLPEAEIPLGPPGGFASDEPPVVVRSNPRRRRRRTNPTVPMRDLPAKGAYARTWRRLRDAVAGRIPNYDPDKFDMSIHRAFGVSSAREALRDFTEALHRRVRLRGGAPESYGRRDTWEYATDARRDKRAIEDLLHRRTRGPGGLLTSEARRRFPDVDARLRDRENPASIGWSPSAAAWSHLSQGVGLIATSSTHGGPPRVHRPVTVEFVSPSGESLAPPLRLSWREFHRFRPEGLVARFRGRR